MWKAGKQEIERSKKHLELRNQETSRPPAISSFPAFHINPVLFLIS
jgi:hypothetical protein